MHIFYTPDITSSDYVLSADESKHAVRVLRVKSGDEVLLVDGKGTLYHAEITVPDAKRCALQVTSQESGYGMRPYYLHMAVAPTKNIDRFEWFLEKATEIGIDEITPIISHHSERKIVKPDRLEKVIVAAMKQSIKATKPILNELCSFEEFLAKHPENLAIAHCNEAPKIALKTLAEQQYNLTLLIGPEGDFSLEEVDLALKEGAVAISLGESRLRTETAAVVACHTVNLMNS